MAGARSRPSSHWVGLDLRETTLAALVFDESFRVVGRDRRRMHPGEAADEAIDRVARCIWAALQQAGVNSAKVSGVGAAAPGLLDHDAGVVVDSPNLGWKKVPLAPRLSKLLGCPVSLVHDPDAAVYGEYSLGAGREARCLVGVFPGAGIGAGCVYEGTLLRSGKRSCMELGHVPLVPDGPMCGCGQRGCLEAVAGRLAIASAAAAAALRGDAPHLLRLAGSDLAAMDTAKLAEAVRAGDFAVECIVRDAARWVGRGVATMVNVMGPDVVVLGGELVDAFPETYLREVDAEAQRHVMPAFDGTWRLVPAKLGADAFASGAAAWVARAKTDTR